MYLQGPFLNRGPSGEDSLSQLTGIISVASSLQSDTTRVWGKSVNWSISHSNGNSLNAIKAWRISVRLT